MLTITGKVLDITAETVNGPTGSFVSEKIHLLSGLQTHAVRVGRDFPKGDLPKKDQDVTLEVVVSAFSGRNGASWNLTALGRVHAPRLAATGS